MSDGASTATTPPSIAQHATWWPALPRRSPLPPLKRQGWRAVAPPPPYDATLLQRACPTFSASGASERSRTLEASSAVPLPLPLPSSHGGTARPSSRFRLHQLL